MCPTEPTRQNRSSFSQRDAPASDDTQAYTVEFDGGLNLDRRQNLRQGLAVLAFMAVGAAIGWSFVEDRPDLAALVGAVLGMIAGTFLSGFVLMCFPPPPARLTLPQLRARRQRTRRKWIGSAIAFGVVAATFPFVISHFGHESSDFAFLICLAWIVAFVGLCAYVKGLSLRLGTWKCPGCGESFGALSTRCERCGFSLVQDEGNREKHSGG